MKNILISASILALSASAAFAQTPSLNVTLGGIESGQTIASKYAYCAPDGKGKTQDGGNINPQINWSGSPAGTKSFAVIVVDHDVPARFDDANKEGKAIPAEFPRQDFYHWVLVDVPPTLDHIAEGRDSTGIHDKRAPEATDYGVSGANSYTKMAGLGGGYNGPCPPWNDERLHHYHFTVYALDVPSLHLQGNFTGKEAEDALKGHVLAQGEAVGTFSNNAQLLQN